MDFRFRRMVIFALLALAVVHAPAAETFRIAEYNVQNYLEEPSGSRPAKSPEAKAAVREAILAARPDVIALEEIGGTNALFELQASLKAGGLDLPNWELVWGPDTNIHNAVLSRFPITGRHPQTNDYFLLAGRRWRVSRGFLDVDIKVNSRFTFNLMSVHLKSKVPTPEADEADQRLEEAKILRSKLDSRLSTNPNLNLVVLGDFNDLQDSEPLKTILGRGNRELVDTRPTERTPDHAGTISWTEHWKAADSYERIDYILLSRAMAREWDANGTYILSLADWETASDHRPLVASFTIPGP